MSHKNYSFEWKPKEGCLIVLDDKTANERDESTLGSMIRQIKKIANNYGFDLSSWSNDSFFSEYLNYRKKKMKTKEKKEKENEKT